MKKCPFCAEEIQDEAILCRYCKKDLKPTTLKDDILYEGKPILGVYVIPLFLWGLLILILWVSGISYKETGGITILYALLFTAMYVLTIANIKSRNYKISTLMINQSRGILFHRYETLDLWRIKDLQFRQGIIERSFNSGTIICISMDKSTPKLILKGLPNAKQIYEKLKVAAFQQRAERKVTGIELS